MNTKKIPSEDRKRQCTMCMLYSFNLRICMVENEPETCEFIMGNTTGKEIESCHASQ
jgi:hypothetical protein